ncbi:hypothetical protein C9374_004407 [Naegleria lovaniensis]|uniref:Uncharacterized protein n=1 Tax=Naegleria lovaniensis TaxID=51637 RepID=A0AA88GS33_NAELO|nr:uncharacterized protein C9374_011209 [Naegleria lovaniensis]XP_044548749.1 uncharacterized protein C9374_004407 [Naegleria lovaniensis]KAG2374130.1 hypothetical protein C9374_011209 [Naegleria lovaniensis]KAG2383070.1 hypothetical protein C9374_004407 [Naegleria lovaniensis]
MTSLLNENPITSITTNALNSSQVLQLQSNHSGVSFILILDGCVFLLGLLILFCCLQNLRLWKKKKQPSLSSSSSGTSSPNLSSPSSTSQNVLYRFFYRLYSWLFLESEYVKIGKLYGQEVSVYLWYQHQFILFFGFATVVGLSCLLPLHLTGTPTIVNSSLVNTTQIETSSFLYRTSVNMVLSLPDRMYAHVILFYAFSLLILFLLYRFSSSKFVTQYINMDGGGGTCDTGSSSSTTTTTTSGHTNHESIGANNSDERLLNVSSTPSGYGSTYSMVSNYSVLVKDLPVECTDNMKFRKAVESAFPNMRIYSCRLIHDTSERIKIEEEYQNALQHIKHYEYVKNETNKHVKLIKLFESSSKKANCCSKIVERVDALNYWYDQKEKLEQQISDWEHTFEMMPKATGYGHIIFKSIHDASECKAQSMNGLKWFKTNEGLDFRIEPRTYEPSDINWKNYAVTSKQRGVRVGFVNIALLILLLFFTSPLAIVSAIQTIANRIPEAAAAFNQLKQASGYTGDLLFHYLPTLLLFLVTQLLPMTIPILTSLEKYKAYSQESRVYLLRLFIYLILSTLVLPVCLLTSLDGILRYFQTEGSGEDWRTLFDRLFLPQSGAFFLNYVIQYALLGCFVDIIRMKDLIKYFYLRFKSVTEEEKEQATTIAEFDLPLEYGYLTSYFGILLTFSVFVPLVLPVGFFYFLVKHIVDRYNISRLCSKNDRARFKISPDITSYRERNKMVVQKTFACLILAQIYITLFFAKTGDVTYIHLFLMSLILILSVVYCFYWTASYRTTFVPSASSATTTSQDTSGFSFLSLNSGSESTSLIEGAFYSEEEELAIFSSQLDKFSECYFPPHALQGMSGLREQKEEEMKQHLNQIQL